MPLPLIDMPLPNLQKFLMERVLPESKFPVIEYVQPRRA
jgi:hypothetical protein